MNQLFIGAFRCILPVLMMFGSGLPVHADQLNLIVNGKAIHLDVPAGTTLNENNWGLGLQYDFDLINGKWLPFTTVSGFIDSRHQPSYYAGGGLLRRYPVGRQRGEMFYLDAGFIAFLMTRDDYESGRPFPGLLPALSLGTRKVGVNLTYIPSVHPKLIPLWFIQLKLAL